MIDTTLPGLGMYLALGRAALKEREEAREREERRQAEENRERIYSEWRKLLDRIEASIPPEFLTYLVEPEKGPRDGLNTGAVRGLSYDLSALGLGELIAFLTNTNDDGVLWIPPFPAELDTGEKALVNTAEVHMATIRRDGMTFLEALATCADRAEEVRTHNEWVTSPVSAAAPVPARVDAPTEGVLNQVYEGIDAYAALAGKGGGFWPVLRVGTDRAEVHDMGRLDAEEFGADYGAEGWKQDMAVHTFRLQDVPGFGDLFAWVSLIRVHPRMWPMILGAKGA